MLALDFENGGRRAGVGTAFWTAMQSMKNANECGLDRATFSINSVVDERGRTVRIHAGDWRAAHRTGCISIYPTTRRRLDGSVTSESLVAAATLRYQSDQAHKSLDMAPSPVEMAGTLSC